MKKLLESVEKIVINLPIYEPAKKEKGEGWRESQKRKLKTKELKKRKRNYN